MAFKYLVEYFKTDKHLEGRKISPEVKHCLNKMLTVDLNGILYISKYNR